MKRLLHDHRGQAFTELALVLFLFFLVAAAVLQLVWLGSAQYKCRIAARRAATLWNTYGHLGLNQAADEIQYILPGCKPEKINGGRNDGISIRVTYTVPAIGFFRLARPNGFPISARSAVIVYNPKPKAPEWVKKGLPFILDKIPAEGGR